VFIFGTFDSRRFFSIFSLGAYGVGFAKGFAPGGFFRGFSARICHFGQKWAKIGHFLIHFGWVLAFSVQFWSKKFKKVKFSFSPFLNFCQKTVRCCQPKPGRFARCAFRCIFGSLPGLCLTTAYSFLAKVQKW